MTNTPPRIVLIRASRETVVLVVAATAMTFAVSLAVHRRPAPAQVAAASPAQQGWTGQLAGTPPQPFTPASAEPLTSASLVVVPPPPPPPLPAILSAAGGAPQRPITKARPCDPPACAAAKPGPQVAPAGPVKPTPVVATKDRDGGLMVKLNPFKHLPEAVRHPFDYAGNAVSGWINRL